MAKLLQAKIPPTTATIIIAGLVVWLFGGVFTARKGYRVEAQIGGYHLAIELTHGQGWVSYDHWPLGHSPSLDFSEVFYPHPHSLPPDLNGDGVVELEADFIPPVAPDAPLEFFEVVNAWFAKPWFGKIDDFFPYRHTVALPLWLLPLTLFVLHLGWRLARRRQTGA